MKLEHEQLDDLAKLATSRCEREIASVVQLIDYGPQVYTILLAVSCAMAKAAADVMQDGMEKQDGKRPPDQVVIGHVVGHILDGLDVKWKRTRSRTLSAKK